MRPLRGETGTPSRGRGPTTPAREARPRATAAVAPHTASVAARSAARHAPANRGVAGCRPPTHAAQQPAVPPSTPPRIDFRRRHTQGHAHSTGASRRTHLPVPSPPLHSHPKSGLRAPAVDGSVGGCHRRPPPTAANPPPGSSPPPGRRSRRRRDGGAATARTRRRPPTRVAPGGGHAHAAAATPSSTAVRATSAHGGTGACAKWQQRLPEGRAQAEEGERGRQRGGSSSASGERSRV